MRKFSILVLLLAACSSADGKAANAATNAVVNNSSNNDTSNNDSNNSVSNNAMNNLPVGACAHATPIAESAQTCRTGEECTDGCGYTDHGPGCGAEMLLEQLCVSDEDCGESAVCVPTFCGDAPCCSGQGTQCIPSCDVDGCADGFDCAEDGHCVANSCEDGYACADGFVCDPARLDNSVDEHGCTVETCVSDEAACPDGMQCDDGAGGNPNGQCVPMPCGSDADCHPNEVCNTPPSIYASGCELADCATDSDCGCGACIQEKCQPRIFVCLSPQAP